MKIKTEKTTTFDSKVFCVIPRQLFSCSVFERSLVTACCLNYKLKHLCHCGEEKKEAFSLMLFYVTNHQKSDNVRTTVLLHKAVFRAHIVQGILFVIFSDKMDDFLFYF